MLPLALVLMGSAPLGLDVRASIQERHLTYAEFGAWIHRTTGTPITVASSLAERKMAIFVKDRPVGETMKRVAEALFLEWEPSGAGFTLRLEPKVADEEATVVRGTLAEGRRRLFQDLEQAVRLANHQDDPLTRSLRDAERADPGEEEGRARTIRDLRDQVAVKRVLGDAWSRLSPAQREGLLAGAPVVAVDGPLPRTVALSPQIAADTKAAYGVDGFDTVRLALSPNSDGTGLALRLSVMNAGSRSDRREVFSNVGGRLPDFLMQDTVLDRRLNVWSRTLDPSLARMILPPLSGASPASGATGYLSLGDCLLSLHRRTGLSIVADGLRTPVMAQSIPDGNQVGDWINRLNSGAGNITGRSSALVRTDEGWLMVRTRRYWNLLAAEIPEESLRRFEASGQRPGGPSLEDYAALVARLTPAQEWGLTFGIVALDAPVAPLTYANARNFPFLRLWNALSLAQRALTRSAGGLPVARMSPDERGLSLAALATRVADVNAPDANVASALGFSPLPPDLRLFVGADADAPAVELLEASSGGDAFPLRIGPRTSEGVVGAFGFPKRPAWVNFVVPLRSVR